jgi:hypothetical protein
LFLQNNTQYNFDYLHLFALLSSSHSKHFLSQIIFSFCEVFDKYSVNSDDLIICDDSIILEDSLISKIREDSEYVEESIVLRDSEIWLDSIICKESDTLI